MNDGEREFAAPAGISAVSPPERSKGSSYSRASTESNFHCTRLARPRRVTCYDLAAFAGAE